MTVVIMKVIFRSLYGLVMGLMCSNTFLSMGGLGLGRGLVFGIVGGTIYGVFIGIFYAISAILYNFIAGKVMGIKVEIKEQ
ncbi:MAG: hypothetical protein QMD06_04405 [Candidatus Altarchaeum sp.]|nr:hypothetical protein [Candidatus Altarchaeum sp.]